MVAQARVGAALMRELPDGELMALVAGGDEAGLEALYDRYSRAVFSLLLRMLSDRQMAEDLAQEVFLRVWRQAGTYQPEKGRLGSWIFRIAHHAAVDEMRRRGARPRQMRDDPEGAESLLRVADASPGPPELLAMGIQREGIIEALSQLSVGQREVIEMAYFGGLTQSEIAEREGMPLGTVKTRTRLGLQRMRACLEAQGIQPGLL